MGITLYLSQSSWNLGISFQFSILIFSGDDHALSASVSIVIIKYFFSILLFLFISYAAIIKSSEQTRVQMRLYDDFSKINKEK